MILKVFLSKFWKNQHFWNLPQKSCRFLANSARFLDSHCSKWLYYFSVNIILGKVKSFETSRWFLCEMVGDLLAVGLFWPTPASFRLKASSLWNFKKQASANAKFTNILQATHPKRITNEQLFDCTLLSKLINWILSCAY